MRIMLRIKGGRISRRIIGKMKFKSIIELSPYIYIHIYTYNIYNVYDITVM